MVKSNTIEEPPSGGSRFDFGPPGTREHRFHIIFDIETGPLPSHELSRMMPEGGFQPRANLRDPEKIAEDIIKKEEDFRKTAALSPSTGQVIAIGVRALGKNTIFHQGEINKENEGKVLSDFFEYFRKNGSQNWIGWSSNQFDWPFLRKRAWVHGLQFPVGVFDGVNGAKWLNYNRNILDAQCAWDAGTSNKTKLDTACKTVGLTGKSGHGANFYKLYNTNQDDAIAYLENDLEITDQLWEIIG